VNEAEDACLSPSCTTRANHFLQFRPEPAAENQFFCEANAEAEQHGIRQLSCIHFAPPISRSIDQNNTRDHHQQPCGNEQTLEKSSCWRGLFLWFGSADAQGRPRP